MNVRRTTLAAFGLLAGGMAAWDGGSGAQLTAASDGSGRGSLHIRRLTYSGWCAPVEVTLETQYASYFSTAVVSYTCPYNKSNKFCWKKSNYGNLQPCSYNKEIQRRGTGGTCDHEIQYIECGTSYTARVGKRWSRNYCEIEFTTSTC